MSVCANLSSSQPTVQLQYYICKVHWDSVDREVDFTLSGIQRSCIFLRRERKKHGTVHTQNELFEMKYLNGRNIGISTKKSDTDT